MFDSHAHVAFSQFDDDRSEVIRRAWDAGLAGWIEVGTDLGQSKKAIELAEKYDNVWATIGVHPSDVHIQDLRSSTHCHCEKPQRSDEAISNNNGIASPASACGVAMTCKRGVWKKVERLVKHPNVKAIGEVGLDYYRGGTKEEQIPVLKQFIALAQKRSLPVVFHIRSSPPDKGESEGVLRDANKDMIELLESYSDDDRPRGVMHTFSGTREQAQRYIELGMYLGFSGVVTFKNAGELIEVAREIPLDRLLVETDCPFLAPEPHRGERNEPAYVKYVVQKIAELRGMAEKKVRLVTQNNTKELFQL